MEFRWRALLLSLVAVLLLVAAGCGGDDNGAEEAGDTGAEQATTAEEAAEPVTLTFWQTMNEEETKTLQELVDRFQDENPNFTIRMETVPFDQAQQRFATAAQGGKAPDVLRAEIAWIADYAAQGFLADITDKVSEEDREDFLEAPFAYGVWEDKVYAIPQVTDAPALLYNKQLFEEAGVEPPESMEDLVAACEKFGAGKGRVLRAAVDLGVRRRPARPRQQADPGRRRGLGAGPPGLHRPLQPRVRVPQPRLRERLRQHADGVQERRGRDDRQRPVGDRGHPQRALVL
jgi:ABC-type glycerol-3-phosphate transport system substrate-binding protein